MALHDLTIKMNVDKTAPFRQLEYGGKGARRCRKCNNHRGFNRKYGLNLCRRCFHGKAEDIGFRSFD